MAFTQRINLPLIPAESVVGRTYIVTGASSGLGREAAQHLVAQGAAKVIMTVVRMDAGEQARAEIEAATGKNTAEVWHLDLSKYESVKSFAKKAIDNLERIDALIENAGIGSPKDHLSEGHPTTITVNVYSTILLAFLLLPKMSESAKRFNTVPRISIVTSTLSYTLQESWNIIRNDSNPITRLTSDDSIDDVAVYAYSKFFEMMSVRHFAPLIPVSKTGVVVNMVCPGLCKTGINRNAPEEYKKNVSALQDQVGRTPEDGSRTLLFGSYAGEESHGRLTADCELKDESLTPDWIKGDEAAADRQKVWDSVAQELEKAEPGVVARVLDSHGCKCARCVTTDGDW